MEKKPLLLIVDDDPDIRAILQNILAENHNLLHANDGIEGLGVARKSLPDLIISDVMMPGMDGFEFCASIRSDPFLRRIPILLLTGEHDLGSKLKGLHQRADDYVTKPFAFAEMLARIRALLRRSEDVTKLQIGDLVLDLIHRKVTRGGEEVQLTGKEFNLLEFFMRHPDEILSREILSEKVWHETFDALTNVIDVYINYLRNKIDRNREPKLIHTVRGVGYTLKTPETK